MPPSGKKELEPLHLPELQAEVAAVVAAAEGPGAAPEKVRVQVVVGDIVAVAEAGTKLRAAVVHAGVVIGAFYHVDTPDTAGGLDLPGLKARRLAEHPPGLLREDPRRFPGQAGDAHQGEEELPELPGALLHIAVDCLQGFFLRHDGLQRLIGCDAGQNLVFQMELLFLARRGVICPQGLQTRVEGGIQCGRLRGKVPGGRRPEILGQIGILHRSSSPFRQTNHAMLRTLPSRTVLYIRFSLSRRLSMAS